MLSAGLSVAVVVGVFWYFLPQYTDVSKVWTYVRGMSWQSELAIAVGEGNFGVNVAPGKPGELAHMIDNLAGNSAGLQRFAAAGRKYVAQFDRGDVFAGFYRELQRLRENAST